MPAGFLILTEAYSNRCQTHLLNTFKVLSPGQTFFYRHWGFKEPFNCINWNVSSSNWVGRI